MNDVLRCKKVCNARATVGVSHSDSSIFKLRKRQIVTSVTWVTFVFATMWKAEPIMQSYDVEVYSNSRAKFKNILPFAMMNQEWFYSNLISCYCMVILVIVTNFLSSNRTRASIRRTIQKDRESHWIRMRQRYGECIFFIRFSHSCCFIH